MKKNILSLLILCVTLLTLCACKKQDIMSVTIGDKTYFSGYLYEFDKANISSKYYLLSSKDFSPQKTGFCFKKKKLQVEDTLSVWNNIIFERAKTSTNISNSSSGTNATVTNILNTYPIIIKETKDTYIINYYDIKENTFPTQEDALNSEPDLHTIEVAKQNVLIEYYN